jgi:hypothetical protein
MTEFMGLWAWVPLRSEIPACAGMTGGGRICAEDNHGGDESAGRGVDRKTAGLEPPFAPLSSCQTLPICSHNQPGSAAYE